jgi:hypothetical protein
MYGMRFAAVYSVLALVVAGAGAGSYLGATGQSPAPRPRCWSSGPDISAALLSAASCRFGKANVAQLGWLPHVGADGYPSRTLDEVAVRDPQGGMSFWLAEVRVSPSRSRVQGWRPCADSC